MIYPSNTLETFKTMKICSDCINFNDTFRTENYLTCNKGKKPYRNFITNCCKFYRTNADN